jgi:two-component sensor histidine kinase
VSSDLRFAVYLPAILATGLLAGVPAAIGAAVASTVIIFWGFMPPHFVFKRPSETDQIDLVLNAVPYAITVYFAYLCRVVLTRLRRSELNNRILAKELEHRGRNLYSIIQVIVKKTLVHDPDSAERLFGRLRSIQYANELLTGKAASVSIKELLFKEFAAYGHRRLQTNGPDFDVVPEHARHLILLFHELTTNAAKYGALSSADGRVYVEWQQVGDRVVLTWKESGGPLISTSEREGFGSQLIAACVRALDGSIRQFFMTEGFACSMNLRLVKCGDAALTAKPITQ